MIAIPSQMTMPSQIFALAAHRFGSSNGFVSIWLVK